MRSALLASTIFLVGIFSSAQGQQSIAASDFAIWIENRGLFYTQLYRNDTFIDSSASNWRCQIASQTGTHSEMITFQFVGPFPDYPRPGGRDAPLSPLGNGPWDSCGLAFIGGQHPPPGALGLDIATYYNHNPLLGWPNSNLANIFLFYIPNDGAQDAGFCPLPPIPSPNVAKPINVTNGNMWIKHTDYTLPGIGENIRVERFYNSVIQQNGLFGFGWSTHYDESLQFYGARMARLNMPDGRAVYLGREGTTGSYTISPSPFYGQLTPNTDGTYTLTFKDGRVHKFNSAGKLLWQRDRNSNQTTLNYNTSGVLTGITDATGRTLTISMNANGNVSQISDSTGNVATYEYELINNVLTNRLKTVTYNDGSKYQFAYTTRIVNNVTKILLTTVKDALDIIVETHGYDDQARATTSEIEGGAERYTLEYQQPESGTLFYFTRVTDILGRQTKYFFETIGGRNQIIKTEGLCGCGSGSESTRFYYDGQGNLIKKTDALGRQTTYNYDNNGNAVSMIDFLGTQTFTYNSFGQVLTATDRMGGVTTNTYSTTGNLLTSKDALNNTTTLTYTSLGQPATIKDARNNLTKFKWFTAGTQSGLLEEIEDPYTTKTRFTWDARARIDTIANTYGHVTNYNYFDDTQRKVEMIYPNSDKVTYKFDIRRLPESTTDERGKITTYEFDPQYRLKKITDPLGHFREFHYDDMSNIDWIKDALGNQTDYRYDAFDRLKEIEYPAASLGATRLKENFEYDKLGRIKKHFDDVANINRFTEYTYDDVNRTNTIKNAELETTTIKYNARIQMTEVKDAEDQIYTFAYDPLGRVLSQTRAGGTMTFEYDEVGNRKKRTDYIGRVTNYEHDSLHRLKKITYGGTGPTHEATYNLRRHFASHVGDKR